MKFSSGMMYALVISTSRRAERIRARKASGHVIARCGGARRRIGVHDAPADRQRLGAARQSRSPSCAHRRRAPSCGMAAAAGGSSTIAGVSASGWPRRTAGCGRPIRCSSSGRRRRWPAAPPGHAEHVEVVKVELAVQPHVLVADVAAADDRHAVVDDHLLVVHAPVQALEVGCAFVARPNQPRSFQALNTRTSMFGCRSTRASIASRSSGLVMRISIVFRSSNRMRTFTPRSGRGNDPRSSSWPVASPEPNVVLNVERMAGVVDRTSRHFSASEFGPAAETRGFSAVLRPDSFLDRGKGAVGARRRCVGRRRRLLLRRRAGATARPSAKSSQAARSQCRGGVSSADVLGAMKHDLRTGDLVGRSFRSVAEERSRIPQRAAGILPPMSRQVHSGGRIDQGDADGGQPDLASAETDRCSTGRAGATGPWRPRRGRSRNVAGPMSTGSLPPGRPARVQRRVQWAESAETRPPFLRPSAC